jgi:hypothetical protein
MVDYIKQQTEYFSNLPCKNDCAQLFADVAECVKNNVSYKKNWLEQRYFPRPNCFEFTKCDEFKKLYQLEKVKTIKYNIVEVKSAFTKSYEIKYNDGNLEISLDWRD